MARIERSIARCNQLVTGLLDYTRPAVLSCKPTYIDADAYMSFELVHQAILKAKSTDVSAVRNALAGLKATTVVGDVEMRAADHQLLRPLVVVQAVKAGDGKGEIAMRSITPTDKIAPPVSPECKTL